MFDMYKQRYSCEHLKEATRKKKRQDDVTSTRFLALTICKLYCCRPDANFEACHWFDCLSTDDFSLYETTEKNYLFLN